MKLLLQFPVFIGLFCVATSCAHKPFNPEQYALRQKIPIEIQTEKPVTIEISSLSGNGVNEVGIQCSPEVWNMLTNGTKNISARLVSSSKESTHVGDVAVGSGFRFFTGYVTNAHYLFYIDGKYHAKATVEITFPNAPAGVTQAEILIGKTPIDTKL